MRPTFAHRVARLGTLAAALATLALAGCASIVPPDTDAVLAARSLAMTDLVAAYAQIESPMSTTLQIETLRADAQPALVDTLLEQGFGVQRVSSDEGSRLVDWSWQEPLDPRTPSVRSRAQLTIGAHTLMRDYLTSATGTNPASPLSIGGTRAPVTLDDSRFAGVLPEVSTVRYSVSGRDAAIDMPLISLLTDDVVAGIARRASGGSASSTGQPSTRGVNGSRIEIGNRYFGASAFGGLRATMDEVLRETIVFPNDSMRLGEDGKRQIAAFIGAYRANSDMIGLIGCSNGPTALAIGNEGLALGRSRRVSDELVSLGVDRARVIDEGCWSGDARGSTFPGRGVVIELLRRKF